MPDFMAAANSGANIEQLKEMFIKEAASNPLEAKVYWENVKAMVEGNLKGGAPATEEGIQQWNDVVKEIDEAFQKGFGL